MNGDRFTQDLAEEVIADLPNGSKQERGEEFLVRAEERGVLAEWIRERTVASLGSYVHGVKVGLERREQAQRLISYGVSAATGRPITPTLSVRTEDGSRQGVLWIDATPAQFIEAVLREQNVIDGRSDSNAVRLKVVRLLEERPDLMTLPTLGHVCKVIGMDPDALGLDGLTGTDS